MESLDVFPAGIAEVWILRADSALPNMAIQFRNDCHKIHTSVIPAWNTSRPFIWLLFGIKWWWGHARMIWMCLSANMPDSAAPNLCRIWCCHWQTHPYHLCMAPPPFNTNNKSYGKSWRIPCRDCWGMNSKSRFSTAKYGNTVSKWLS